VPNLRQRVEDCGKHNGGKRLSPIITGIEKKGKSHRKRKKRSWSELFTILQPMAGHEKRPTVIRGIKKKKPEVHHYIKAGKKRGLEGGPHVIGKSSPNLWLAQIKGEHSEKVLDGRKD